MKSRRVILTIEVQTCLPLSELRDPYSITFPHRGGGGTVFADPGMEKQGVGYGTIVQVQADSVQPVRKAYRLPADRSEQERRDARAKLAKKFADKVSTWPAKKLRACLAQPETVAAAEKRERKAKRAKGAK